MAENSFQIWDDVIHTMPDQMKRIDIVNIS